MRKIREIDDQSALPDIDGSILDVVIFSAAGEAASTLLNLVSTENGIIAAENMNQTAADSILNLKLEMIPSVALAALVLFLGYFVKKKCAVLDRLNIPAPVVGGLIFASAALALKLTHVVSFQFELVLQGPFMIAFFTTIGLTASLSLLKVGGPQVVVFWILASLLAAIQNGAGVLISKILGVHSFLGLIAGSVTMTGGHGTGLAFGPVMEKLGMPGATSLAVAAATFGLVSGGLIGGPVGTYLITKKRLLNQKKDSPQLQNGLSADVEDAKKDRKVKLELNANEFLKYLALILVCMWIGALVSSSIEKLGITLPAYIGSMLVAAVLRNVTDLTKVTKISTAYVELLGTVALNLFLSMALMSLRLWELFDLAVPLTVILIVQVGLISLFAVFITYRFMGRDYDAAVMASGHCGFGLGATPNAVANMEALVDKFGPAPRAFLVIPIVGAFLIDFSNALIITFYINILK